MGRTRNGHRGRCRQLFGQTMPAARRIQLQHGIVRLAQGHNHGDSSDMTGQGTQIGEATAKESAHCGLCARVQLGEKAVARVLAGANIGPDVIAVPVGKLWTHHRLNGRTHRVLRCDQVQRSRTIGVVRVQ